MADGISYQNKDVLFKILSENYKNKSLLVYGLNLPPIKEVLPTNLPTIQLDEKRADNIFMLEDDTLLILEYESSVDARNLIKYGHYAFRVAEAYYEHKLKSIVIAVIYTGEIETAPHALSLGCIELKTEQVFLANFDGKKIHDALESKVDYNEPLTDEDVMNFIILPLTKQDGKQKLIEDTVNLAKKVNDEDKQSFIIAGILSATDKFIDKEYSNRIKEWLKMTKVGRLFEEEKQEAVNEAINETTLDIAKNLLSNNIDILTIMKATGLSRAEILNLDKKVVSN